MAVLSRILSGNPAARQKLSDAGVAIVVDLDGYTRIEGDAERWNAILADIDALVVGLQPVDEALLAAAPRLKYVLRIGTGTDNIDLRAARTRGVRVATLAGMNAEAVAEYAFGLLLAAARRIPEADAMVRRGDWGRLTGQHLGGRRLGLIGYGDIGRAMVPKALGFGMEVVVSRRSSRPLDDDRVRLVTLDELLATSPFISLHVPLTDGTRHLIGAREIGLMHDAVLVNTARGEVVDEAALCAGLVSGHIAACALDVFTDEPPAGSPLLSLPNVVLSPHNGGYSDRTIELIARSAVERLLRDNGWASVT